MSQKNSVRRSAIILVLAIAYFVSTILFEGRIENYLNPPREHIFDPLADSANWEEYKIPEINMSFKLPPNTKVYTRESVAKGSVNDDEDFEWVSRSFELKEMHFAANNSIYPFHLLIAVYPENNSIFRENYNQFSKKKLMGMVDNNYSYGSLKSSYFLCNDNVFIYDIKPYVEDNETVHFYDTLIKNNSYLLSFHCDMSPLTLEQQSIQNAIVKSIIIS